jgi:hypothetical protein
MATLTGNKVKDSYQSLLKLSTAGATSTIKTVEDGLGVSTALKVSTDTVEVKNLKISTTPTVSSSELTVLVYDDATDEVKTRDLDASAFTGATAVFANPMFILRPSAAYTLTTSAATPTQAGVNNGSNASSHFVNDSSNTHFQTSSTTTGAVTVESAGLVKIDVNFILEITSGNTDIVVNIMEKPSGGSATTIQSITRSHADAGNTAIGFSIVRHADADTDLYYTINKSGGGGGLLTTSTFILTKLD